MSSKLLALSLAAGPLMFGATIPVDDSFQEQLDQSARTFASSLYSLMGAGRKSNSQASIAASSVVDGCPGPRCIASQSSNSDWSNFAMQDRQYFPTFANARYSVSLAAAVVRLLSNEIISNRANSAPASNNQNTGSGSRAAFDIVLNSIAWAQRGGDPRLISTTTDFDRWMPGLSYYGRNGGSRDGNSSNSSGSTGSGGSSSVSSSSSGGSSSVPHWVDDDPVEGTVHATTSTATVVASNPEPRYMFLLALAVSGLAVARSAWLRKRA